MGETAFSFVGSLLDHDINNTYSVLNVSGISTASFLASGSNLPCYRASERMSVSFQQLEKPPAT